MISQGDDPRSAGALAYDSAERRTVRAAELRSVADGEAVEAQMAADHCQATPATAAVVNGGPRRAPTARKARPATSKPAAGAGIQGDSSVPWWVLRSVWGVQRSPGRGSASQIRAGAVAAVSPALAVAGPWGRWRCGPGCYRGRRRRRERFLPGPARTRRRRQPAGGDRRRDRRPQLHSRRRRRIAQTPRRHQSLVRSRRHRPHRERQTPR